MDPGDEPRTPTWTPTSTPTRAAAAATVTLDDLLAAAARTVPAAPQAERRAVAAFRAARDAGAPAVPTRRRDDWRPARPRIRARWIKVGLGSFVAALMLGGVAMAAGAIPAPFGDGHGPGPVPSASPSRDGGTTAPGGPFVPVPPKVGPAGPTGDERPPTAKDQLAQCRAYEARHGRPGSLDSPAWQRLEDAAGGPDAVAAYCAGLLAERPLPQPSKERPSRDAKVDESGAAPGQKPSGRTH
ncbi:hypothetical protein OG905_09690 [Streptomyces sp. NBC_00322]|uniref:hypothetical protein n=1 Tax=Streptomyces sp. NBC_00322 TaxID=2975712 RepID=UPI002E2CCB32|nr:hypothetical protein [Streptomyces sp. NBC_00322]